MGGKKNKKTQQADKNTDENQKEQEQESIELKTEDQVIAKESTEQEHEKQEESKVEVIPTKEQKVNNKHQEREYEEEKQSKKLGLQRKDSKFQMQKGDTQDNRLFRPEFGYDKEKKGNEKIWDLMSSYIGNDQKSIQRAIVNHVEYTLARTRFNFDNFGAYQATSLSIKDRLIEALNDTNEYYLTHDVKRVYYMSLEFLLGRLMQNALVNIDLEQKYKEALLDIGYNLEEIYENEVDPGLGNGGLGRLAACFLDSLATLDIPAWGYGIRYDYGIFKQMINDGYQVEIPDYWLEHGNPWEIERADVTYPVRFYGHVNKYKDGGVERANWEGGEVVLAMAYDTPVPGFNTFNTNNLRLWRSKPFNEFDFNSFNKGDYHSAIGERQKAEYITSVLYPNDSTEQGKELRLKQQYFFCSATIRDIIRRYKKIHNDWSQFAEKNQIQLNDTHPAIATIELIRIFIDEEKLPWDQAWNIVYHTFAYTNHTVLPEALEKWSVGLIGKLLPRHLDLIYLINYYFLEKVKKRFPNDEERISRMSLIEEGDGKKVRMAFLSIVCSHTVNGVAALHSDLLKKTIFKDFEEMFPNKIQNKTNGVTPRRWIHCCNKELSDLITDKVAEFDEWITDSTLLRDLDTWSDDKEFQQRFIEVKMNSKRKLQKWVKDNTGYDIPLHALYDVMVKRMHEYKRQLMNILYIIYRYQCIKETPKDQRKDKFQPRVCMIGGKAAPGYWNAKSIIKLINNVGAKINNDNDVGDLLKVVFLPNYCVSAAQIIIPASELSQHISTAGTEASGTSNMKFVMNGCLIIGTMDGANVEIAEEIGENNMFIFGERVEGVEKCRKRMRDGDRTYVGSRLRSVFNMIRSGTFGDLSCMNEILSNLENGNDHYIVCFDFYHYLQAQEEVDRCYKDYSLWTQKAIHGIAYSGKFSSDRTIQEYCKDIWKIEPCTIPKPSTSANTRVRSFANLREATNYVTENQIQ